MGRSRKRQREIRRRRAVAGALVLGLVVAIAAAVISSGSDGTVASGASPRRPAAPQNPARPSDRTLLRLRAVITGRISPKSVASSGTGFVTAQNMMYRHTVTVYDARALKLVKTIPDAVHLARLGYPQFPSTARGAPVEAAFSPEGRYAYVSNYSMYGAGFGPEGSDSCTPSSGYDRSFVYRIDMQRLRIDRVYRVGAVPKVVAVTPDGRYVLVTNWCSWDLSVVSTERPRGAAHPHRPLPARHRRRARRQRGVRRGHGQ